MSGLVYVRMFFFILICLLCVFVTEGEGQVSAFGMGNRKG